MLWGLGDFFSPRKANVILTFLITFIKSVFLALCVEVNVYSGT